MRTRRRMEKPTYISASMQTNNKSNNKICQQYWLLNYQLPTIKIMHLRNNYQLAVSKR